MVNVDLGSINYLAVILAGVVAWILGAVWYARPLFGGRWMEMVNISEDARKGAVVGFIGALVAGILLALFLAFVLQALGASGNIGNGIVGALLVWFGFMAIPAASNVLFEKRSWGLFLINMGYYFVAFILMGIILSVWV